MQQSARILLEGYTPAEILEFSDAEVNSFVFTGEPIVFQIGSAEVLGQFRITSGKLTVELAQIEGGGEGVLPTLWALVNRYAVKCEIGQVEWIVHAVNCAKPNPKLRHMLERLGFIVKDIPEIGTAYYYLNEEQQS